MEQDFYILEVEAPFLPSLPVLALSELRSCSALAAMSRRSWLLLDIVEVWRLKIGLMYLNLRITGENVLQDMVIIRECKYSAFREVLAA